VLTTPDQVSSFLAERFAGSEVVLFAGAGVGKRAGLPDWAEYTESLASFVGKFEAPIAELMRARASAGRFAEAFRFLDLCDSLPPAEKFNALKDPLTGSHVKPDLLVPLVTLPFSSIVTTNFDASLLDAFVTAHGKRPATAGPSDVPLQECPYIKGPCIARIHGRVEHPPSMVLSTDAYQRIQEESSYIDFLNFLFTHKRCLFLGFSFMDPAIANVLDTIAKKLIASAEVHHALLPADAPPVLTSRLAQAGIRTELYKSDGSHAILWEGISQAASFGLVSAPATTTSSRIYDRTKHIVALAYAVARVSDEEGPALSNLVLQGIVLSSFEDKTAEIESVVQSLRSVVPMDEAEAAQTTQRLLADLEDGGLISRVAGRTGVWKLTEKVLDKPDPIASLLDSFENRLLVRESYQISAEDRVGVSRLIEQVVYARAWELAQDFMSSFQEPETSAASLYGKLEGAARALLPRLSADRRDAVVRTIAYLFSEPEPKEDLIIADLTRAAFGVQVITNAGRTALHNLILPQSLYLDSNILMPLVVEGHPNSHGIDQAIRKLGRSSGKLTVSVADVFLNEVISHRKRAVHEYNDLSLDKGENVAQYVDYFGLLGINAYLAAYFNRKEELLSNNFQRWLALAAPYTTETELAAWLRGKGILIVDTSFRERGEMTDLNRIDSALTSAYDADEEKRKYVVQKPDVLIRHEARMLKVLSDDQRRGARSYFVTNDKKLKSAVHASFPPEIEESIVSHLGLIQLIDLTVGNKCEPHILNRVVWSVAMIDDRMYLRNYLTSRIQKKYDAAMLLTMPKMLDAFVDRAAREAKLEKVDIVPNKDTDKGRTTRFIGRIEGEFFKAMAEEMKKVKKLIE
jgi:hypothetical protein